MKPDWDKLGKAFQDSNVLIADIDCTADDAKSACESNKVEGYPTIKYFNESNGKLGEKYDGQRDLKTLKKFVKKVLKGKERVCEAALVEGGAKAVPKEDCSPQEGAYLEKWGMETLENIAKESSRLTKKLDEVLKTEQRKQFQFESKMLALLKKAFKGKASVGEEL